MWYQYNYDGSYVGPCLFVGGLFLVLFVLACGASPYEKKVGVLFYFVFSFVVFCFLCAGKGIGFCFRVFVFGVGWFLFAFFCRVLQVYQT